MTDTPVTEADLATLTEQLGRVPRGVVAVAARCVCGRPTVVRTAPRLPDGSPFPTTYYLTHPAAVKGCSTLEAEHLMDSLNERLTLCSMVTEMSGKVPLIMPSGEVLKWLVERAGPVVAERSLYLPAFADGRDGERSRRGDVGGFVGFPVGAGGPAALGDVA